MPYKDPDIRREKQKIYYERYQKKNALKIKERRRLFRLKHKESLYEYTVEYRESRKDWYSDYMKEYNKEYREKNKEVLAEKRRQKYRDDPNYKIKVNLRSRLSTAVSKDQKAGSAVDDLGCSIPEFKEYIASKFTEGMSWDNYGEWHLDHIRPLASFDLTKREEFVKAVHFSNYQPLWAVDNIKKGARY